MDTIIFIPGHGCTKTVFATQMQTLSMQYHCLCIDLRDYTSIEAVVAAILKQAPEKFFILGFSLGAAIALHVSQQFPERIKGLMHISLPFEGPSAGLIAELTQIAQTLPEMEMSAFIELAYQKYFPHQPNHPVLHATIAQMLLETGKTHYLQQAKMLLHPWNLLPKAHAQHPVLILGGVLDKRAKPEYHQAMAAQLTHATLYLIPNAGHFLTIEQPEVSSQKLQEWLLTEF